MLFASVCVWLFDSLVMSVGVSGLPGFWPVSGVSSVSGVIWEEVALGSSQSPTV